IIEFVDTCMCGDYHMTIDRSEKDALKNVPGAGLTLYEQMGLASKADRFTNSGLEQLGAGPFNQNLQSKQFDRLEEFAKLNRPPAALSFRYRCEGCEWRPHGHVVPWNHRS